MTNLMPSPSEMQKLEAEICEACQHGRTIVKGNHAYEWNESVYAPQRSGPESSTRTEQFGLDLAGRTARNSWQQEMSPQGEPLSPFGSPMELLTRSQVETLRTRARTRKGRRMLEHLVHALGEAGGW